MHPELSAVLMPLSYGGPGWTHEIRKKQLYETQNMCCEA